MQQYRHLFLRCQVRLLLTLVTKRHCNNVLRRRPLDDKRVQLFAAPPVAVTTMFFPVNRYTCTVDSGVREKLGFVFKWHFYSVSKGIVKCILFCSLMYFIASETKTMRFTSCTCRWWCEAESIRCTGKSVVFTGTMGCVYRSHTTGRCQELFVG